MSLGLILQMQELRPRRSSSTLMQNETASLCRPCSSPTLPIPRLTHLEHGALEAAQPGRCGSAMALPPSGGARQTPQHAALCFNFLTHWSF